MTDDELAAWRVDVGDRVRMKHCRWPNATVTEVTADGFKWKFDEPFFLGARQGWIIGGEALALGHWEPLPRGEADPRKLQWDDESSPLERTP